MERREVRRQAAGTPAQPVSRVALAVAWVLSSPTWAAALVVGVSLFSDGYWTRGIICLAVLAGFAAALNTAASKLHTVTARRWAVRGACWPGAVALAAVYASLGAGFLVPTVLPLLVVPWIVRPMAVVVASPLPPLPGDQLP